MLKSLLIVDRCWVLVLVLVLVIACPVFVNITGIFITISERNACVMVVLI